MHAHVASGIYSTFAEVKNEIFIFLVLVFHYLIRQCSMVRSEMKKEE